MYIYRLYKNLHMATDMFTWIGSLTINTGSPYKAGQEIALALRFHSKSSLGHFAYVTDWVLEMLPNEDRKERKGQRKDINGKNTF